MAKKAVKKKANGAGKAGKAGGKQGGPNNGSSTMGKGIHGGLKATSVGGSEERENGKGNQLAWIGYHIKHYYSQNKLCSHFCYFNFNNGI